MSLLFTLLKIEAIKAVRRFGFWITFLVLGGFLVVIHGSGYYAAVRSGNTPAHLPDAWSGILLGLGPVAGFFGAVALILLVAAEFSWNTARQNVIDGLSKEQFFLAKALLIPTLALLVLGIQVGVGAGTALLGNLHLGELEWPLIRRVQMGFFLGFLLQTVGFLALAFLAAIVARSAGAAMGLYLLYAAIVEQILGGVLRDRGGWLEAGADFLPVTVFADVARAVVWDPDALAAAAAAAASQGRAPPEVLGPLISVGVALAWIGVLVFLSFLVYRTRDL